MTIILQKHIAGLPACQEPSATAAAAAAASSNLKITFNLLILNSFHFEINFEGTSLIQFELLPKV